MTINVFVMLFITEEDTDSKKKKTDHQEPKTDSVTPTLNKFHCFVSVSILFAVTTVNIVSVLHSVMRKLFFFSWLFISFFGC